MHKSKNKHNSKNKNKNVNKNNINININTSKKRSRAKPISSSSNQKHGYLGHSTIINNIPSHHNIPSHNNNNEILGVLKTFRNDLDELKRVRLNNFENGNTIAQPIINTSNIEPDLNTLRNIRINHYEPSSSSLFVRNGSESLSIPRSNSNSSIFSNITDDGHSTLNNIISHIPSNNSSNKSISIKTETNTPKTDNHSILNQMSSHIPSISSHSTSSTKSNKTIQIAPEDMIIHSPNTFNVTNPPNTTKVFNNPKIMTTRETIYRKRNDDSDSENDNIPTNMKILNTRFKIESQSNTITPYFQRNRTMRLITQNGEPNLLPIPPPPENRPSRTNLLAIMNEEHNQSTIKEKPHTNDINEISSNGLFTKTKNDKKNLKSDIENARYHSYTDNFNKTNSEHREAYNVLLDEYNNKNPSIKLDADFYKNGEPRKPSKERYKKLRQKLEK